MIMTVYPDVIRRSEPIRLLRDDSVFAAARLMRQNHVGAVLVMQGDRLEGIFTERDLSHRVIACGLEPADTAVSTVMTPEPATIATGDTVMATLDLMEGHNYRHLPVTDAAGLFGVVAARDVVRACREQLESVLEDMSVPPAPHLQPVGEVFPERDLVQAGPGSSVREAADAMARNGVGAVLVMAADRLLGILTERDIAFRVVSEALDPAATSLDAVMTPDPVTAPPAERQDDLLSRMVDAGFRHMPLVDGTRVTNVVSIRDLYGFARGVLDSQFRAAMRERARQMTADG